MSKVNRKAQKGTDKLFNVTWEELVIIGARIWAKSPKEAVEKAKEGNFNNFVQPSGCFSKSIPDSYVVEEEIEGAVKKDFKSDGNHCIEIYY